MAVVQRSLATKSCSEAYIALYDIDEDPGAVASIVEFVDQQRARCAGCLGNCGLKATVSQHPTSVPEESFEYQFFGVETDGTTTIVDLSCDSPNCEGSGFIKDTANEIDALNFVS